MTSTLDLDQIVAIINENENTRFRRIDVVVHQGAYVPGDPGKAGDIYVGARYYGHIRNGEVICDRGKRPVR